MKSDTIETKLEAFLSFKNGKSSPNRDDRYSVPVYGSNGLIGYSEESNAKEKSTIIGRVGSYCGSVYYSEEESWITDNAIITTSKNTNESLFWYYLLKSTNLHNFRTGSGQPLLTQTALKSIKVKVPNSAEQRITIGDVLYDFDKKAQLNRQINGTLESIAQTIFKSWFVDFDPVRAKIRANHEGYDPERAAMAAISGVSLEKEWEDIEATLAQKMSNMTEEQCEELKQTAALFPEELEDSELGEIPKGWGTKPLDEVADYLNGRAMQKYPPEEGKETLPVLKISQLRKGDTSDADIASADIPERLKVYNGDMIFSWSGSLLIDLWCGGDAALNQHLFKVTSENYEKWFYYLWTKHHLDNFIRIAEAKAVTMGHIKRSHLAEAKCVIPDSELLEMGSKKIGPLLDKVIQLRLESKNMEKLRDTLLPKLISGEVEV